MRNGKYCFGIIGLGAIARFHAGAIASLPDAQLIAAFDMVSGKADAFCKDKPGVKPYESLDAFLAEPDLDIVTVTTPSGAHLDVALAAIRARKNVIVEKPMEITTERIDTLIRAAKEEGVMLSGVFQSRFRDSSRIVKKAIEDGRFGKLTLLSAQVKWWRSQDYYDKIAWHGTWKMDGGGALMNQSIHAIDLLQWFGGPVKEISGFTATLGHERIEVEDTAGAVLRFTSGALGIIEGSTAVFPGFMKRLEISGTKGSAIIVEDSLDYWHFDKETPEDEEIRKKYKEATTSGGASDPNALDTVGHARCFSNVIDALKNHTDPLITGEEARKAVEIITSIYKSARTGRPVEL